MSKEVKAAIIGAVITGIFAIIAACIGGPLIVELIKGGEDDLPPSPSPASQTESSAPIDSPQPATPVDTPATATSAAVPEPTYTPSGIRDPVGPVPAGTPILADDFSLVVQDSFDTYGEKVGITLVVQNTGGRTRLLRFQCSAIRLKDNLGNVYKSQGEGSENLYATRQIEIAPGEAILLEPANSWAWASVTYIPRFVGPVSAQADWLVVLIDGLGPFTGLEIEIAL